jgi:PIN like domain
MPRDEPLEFFVDETTLGVGRALAQVRGDVVHPGHRRLPDVPVGTKDPDWMPVIAKLGLVVISRDRHIKSKPAELEAFRDLGLRAFWIAGDRDLGNWENLTRLVKWWPTIERKIAEMGPGPWFYSLNLTTVTELLIRPPRPARGSSSPTTIKPKRRKNDQLKLPF